LPAERTVVVNAQLEVEDGARRDGMAHAVVGEAAAEEEREGGGVHNTASQPPAPVVGFSSRPAISKTHSGKTSLSCSPSTTAV
jgi:hypothetical protein